MPSIPPPNIIGDEKRLLEMGWDPPQSSLSLSFSRDSRERDSIRRFAVACRRFAVCRWTLAQVVGAKQDLSAGLVTGGKKDFFAEQSKVGRMCILVATPGRVLQHLEESPDFDASRVLALVVDEADRVVDLGFAPQLDAVVGYLPQERLTMLFSATLAGPAASATARASSPFANAPTHTHAHSVPNTHTHKAFSLSLSLSLSQVLLSL